MKKRKLVIRKLEPELQNMLNEMESENRRQLNKIFESMFKTLNQNQPHQAPPIQNQYGK
jgi:hypothetical protein